MLALRAERDAIFGTSATDEAGAWMRLLQYKAMVRARLGLRHPLSKTVPIIGDVNVESYLTICHRFIDHWTRVNAALPSPLDAGTTGEIEVTTWDGIVVVNEIDRVTIRNGDGITIAGGVRNIALPEPATV